ncbi:hypothetical protein K2X05_01120 [bacterium]|nr:hypothetical protein [bacterium]
MEIDVFSSKDLKLVFRVLRTALNPSNILRPEELSFLETYSKITGFSIDVETLEPILANEVRLEGAHQRKRLIQLSAMAALLSNPVRKPSVLFIQQLSTELSTYDSVISTLVALEKGQKWKARILTARRGLGAMLKEAYLTEGILGVFRFLAALFFKTRVNKDKHLKYKRLGLLSEGTLGREYWKHITELGFGFPGESGGIPDSVAYHDVGHVLADHDTTPLGEIQQGSFQGGNRREDGFFFIQFVILQFHHGIKITPVAPGETGYFEPTKVLWAIHRGAQCNVDITHQWNFWPLMSLPLSEARKVCGLISKT